MRPKHYSLPSPEIANYVATLLDFEADLELQEVLQEAKKGGTPPLHLSLYDARHLEVLTRIAKPRTIVEIGTLCGLSALILARGLVPGGKIYTCERSAHHARIARQIFQKRKQEDIIEIIEGDACQTLPELSKRLAGPVDMVFVDADKENYPFYLEWAVEHLQSGGLLVADNVFAFGYIGGPTAGLPPTLVHMVEALEDFNKTASLHPQLTTTFLPTGEGLLVAVKK